jgi:NADH-quinone oxidoreductase subunit J
MIVFWILAILLIASAVFTVTAQKPVYSVVGLLVNFVALAATYLELHAEFLAVIQIIVYSGAILSSGVKPFEVGPNRAPRIAIPAIVFAALVLAGIAATVAGTRTAAPSMAGGVTGDANAFGSVANFGAALFTTYLLPFEVTALILMVAVVGVVLIAGDEGPGGIVRRRKRRAIEREPIVKRERVAP